MPEIAMQERDAILRMLFGGTKYLGLARSSPDDEETDSAYTRRAINLSEPQGDDLRFVTNEAPILFPEYRQDAARPVLYAFISDTPDGPPKFSERLKAAKEPKAGEIIFFATGELRIGAP